MSVACPFNRSTCVLDLCSATHLLKSVLYTTGSQEITSPTAGVGTEQLFNRLQPY